LAAPVPAAYAQQHPEKPPFAVGGFRYMLMPSKMHMNICEAAMCTPGSRVSYILLSPGPAPSFEQFKAQRKVVAEALRKARAAQGVTIDFGSPQRSKDKLFTVFKVRRVETYPDGRKLFFWNQQIFSERISADIISSSPNEKAAETNLALFTLPMMMTAVTKPGTERAR
jgi:hypothetical protein